MTDQRNSVRFGHKFIFGISHSSSKASIHRFREPADDLCQVSHSKFEKRSDHIFVVAFIDIVHVRKYSLVKNAIVLSSAVKRFRSIDRSKELCTSRGHCAEAKADELHKVFQHRLLIFAGTFAISVKHQQMYRDIAELCLPFPTHHCR